MTEQNVTDLLKETKAVDRKTCTIVLSGGEKKKLSEVDFGKLFLKWKQNQFFTNSFPGDAEQAVSV